MYTCGQRLGPESVVALPLLLDATQEAVAHGLTIGSRYYIVSKEGSLRGEICI